MRTYKYALAGVTLFVCTAAPLAAQTTPRLAWDGDGKSVVTGYEVSIDGVRTDHGLAPLRSDGTCGCSIALPFSGGRRTIVVTAYNAAGRAPSASFVVGPSASAGGPYSGSSGTAVAVSAAGSVAPTGSLTSYRWKWGDNTSDTVSASPSASHVYAAAGTYTLTLTVTDNAGASASATTSATITAAAQPLPAPWIAQDIGSVGRTGSTSYSNGRFTVAGSGADIWGTADAFRFVHQRLSGEGVVVARVTGIGNTNYYAKAGVMLRAGLDAGSPHVLLNVMPSGGVEFMRRSSQSGSTTVVASRLQVIPIWLGLHRTGSTVNAYASQDAVSWIHVGSTTVSLGTSPYAGLAVTSHDNTILNTSTFDSAIVVGAGTAAATANASGDIVVHVGDHAAVTRRGNWAVANDSQSPGGLKLTTPDNGATQTNAPLASPSNYVDVAFQAPAGTSYRVWLRLRAKADSKYNDSVWVQFSDSLAGQSPAYRINTTSGLLVNLATDSSGGSLSGWGWQDDAYWLTRPAPVSFASDGLHTLRIQIREDGVELDQIVLSPSRYLSTAPGALTNDGTIVPE